MKTMVQPSHLACDVRRQPARATVLAVFERAADRGFFFGFVLPAKPVLLGLAVHAAMCGPDLIGALANAVFQALVHVRRPSALMMERS